MLDFDEFCEHVRYNMKYFLPDEFEDAEVVINTVTKNNGKQLKALNVRLPESRITPNIYLESFYENYAEQGMDLETCLERIAKLELEHQNPSEDFVKVADSFRDPEFIKPRVVMAIINAEKNAELLKEVPSKPVEDLSVIYKVYLGGDKDGIGTILVRNEHLKEWGISLDELHELALENSKRLLPAEVMSMGDVLSQMMGEDMPDLPLGEEDEKMFVISNTQKVNGAASIIYSDALEKLSERLGTDLYVLPSSIHETIAISANYGDADQLEQMVREVNATTVLKEEQLSDHVYRYDAKTKTLSIADIADRSLDESKVSENAQSYETNNEEAVRPRHHR